MGPSLTYVLPVDWLGLPQRFHAVARGLAEAGWRVRVLCPRPHGPLWRAGRLGALLRPWEDLDEGPGLRVRRVPALPGYRRSPQGVRLQWAQGWRLWALAARGWGPSDWLLLADPSLAPLAQALPHRRLAYEAVDAWPGFWPGALGEALAAQERAVAQAADLVVATTPALAQALGRPDALVLPNGVDGAAFGGPLPPPPEAPAAWAGEAPRVGLMAHMGSWVDLARVRRLAQAMPRWRFFVLGPAEGREGDWGAWPNVWRELWVAPEARPAWLNLSPLWWVPFAEGPVAQAADPLKAYEALAAGRRLLAPPLPALAGWGPALVPLVGDDVAWAAALEGAWDQGALGPEERAALAPRLAHRVWPQLVGRLDAALRQALSGPQRGPTPTFGGGVGLAASMGAAPAGHEGQGV